jgi:hypothetical protein
VGVLAREHAEIGVMISLEEPTREMRREAAAAGFYENQWDHRKHPRVQLLTIAEILGGKSIDYPPSQQVNVTFKRAAQARAAAPIAENMTLELGVPAPPAKPAKAAKRRSKRRS